MFCERGESTRNGTTTGLSEPGSLRGEFSMLRPDFVRAQRLGWAFSVVSPSFWDRGAVFLSLRAFASASVRSV